MHTRGRKRRAVVGPHRHGQAVLPKGGLEDRPRRARLRRVAPMTVEPEARVQVDECQRIAGDPVAGAELALAIRRPEIVGRLGMHPRRARVIRARAAAAGAPHQTFPLQQVRDRARRGPVAPARVPPLQHLEQLPRAPIVVLDPKLAAERRHLVRDLVRTVMRRATTVRHAALALARLAE